MIYVDRHEKKQTIIFIGKADKNLQNVSLKCDH